MMAVSESPINAGLNEVASHRLDRDENLACNENFAGKGGGY